MGKHIDGGSIDTYQRMIHHMDEGMSWLLGCAGGKGLSENTPIVFTSDNGGERFSNTWPAGWKDGPSSKAASACLCWHLAVRA